MNASTMAAMEIAKIPSMQTRSQSLATRFLASMHNAKEDSQVVAVRFLHAWTRNQDMPEGSLRASIANPLNQLWTRMEKNVRTRLNQIMRQPDRDPVELKHANAEIARLYEREVRGLELMAQHSRVAGALIIEQDVLITEKIHPAICSHGKNPARRMILLWVLGRICMHQNCENCLNAELSRKHGVHCSGAAAILEERMPELWQYWLCVAHEQHMTIIDWLIMIYRVRVRRRERRVDQLVSCVTSEWQVCGSVPLLRPVFKD
jgi:hypothetical protein